MRVILILFVVLFAKKVSAQEIYLYTDTVNKFSIGMPSGWQYQSTTDKNPGIKLIVFKEKGDLQNFQPNYNVNIVPLINSNVDMAFETMISFISKAEGFEIISKGDTTYNGKKHIWLKEHHLNSLNKMPMAAIVYLGFKDDTAYIATFSFKRELFKDYEDLFKLLSSTFQL